MRVALVSRGIYPLAGGGIGQFVTSAARLLSRIAEVTILTTAGLGGVYAREYEQLRAVGDGRLPGDGVRVVFVPEPSVEEAAGWYHVMHCYSARVLECLREAYPDGGPEVIEFADYLGEGFVTLQAAWALDPFLASTRICVRLHTSTEMVEVLDGYLPSDLPSRVVHELERFCLARADRVLWAGGDVLGAYQRFYGVGGLGLGVRVRHPFVGEVVGGEVGEVGGSGDGCLRLLYAGRLERRKGVLNLVRAVTGLGRDDFCLSLVGGDTGTGPLGVSMREQLELLVGGDERVVVRDGVGRGELAGLIRGCDVVVVPSLWECWPYAVLEPLFLNRPVLGTPVGGLVELVGGGGGWLADGCGVDDLASAVVGLLEDRGRVEGLVGSGGLVRWGRGLCDEQAILDGYEGLVGVGVERPVWGGGLRVGGGSLPLVSVVVPYFGASEFVRETVCSVLEQSYSRLEVVLVVDGSFEDVDWCVAELGARFPVLVVSQVNQGLGAARNLGVARCRGRYVFPLDADNVAEAGFVERCVGVLEARPEVGYVTSWSRYVLADGSPRVGGDVGYEPLGNQSGLVGEENVAGDAAAVIRRRLFELGFAYSEELTSYEDWHFYRELAAAGWFGAVIPERLLRYRVREDSMQARIAQPNRERLLGEIEARIKENAMRWTSPNA